MRLARTSTRILTALALSFCLVPGSWAQTQPVNKTRHKAKPTATLTASPAADTNAPAAKPAISEAGKRDPFVPLVNEHKAGGGGPVLPPGKAGLVVATVHVDGTVSSPNGMLAVVSNPDQRVYFLREGDRLYDGDVEKIGLDGVTFKENSKDAFGKPVERTVTKRIYSSAGAQQ
jgi:Tfp pilus assembly protein PilP